MISIYCFYIFMITVKVSNSINQNYAVIHNLGAYTDNHQWNNGFHNYSTYNADQFDEQLLDPKDFFLSIYNPYYYFLPSPYINRRCDHDGHVTSFMGVLYHNKIHEGSYSLTATSSDLHFSGIDPIYWHKRPKFYTLNINITNVCALYNLANIYCNDVKEYDPKAIVQSTIDTTITEENKPTRPKLELDDIFTLDKVIEIKPKDDPTVIEIKPKDDPTVAPKFYSITENEYHTLKKLTSYLPITKDYFTKGDTAPQENKETIDGYLSRHDENVKYYLYLNKNLYSHIQSNPIKKMSTDRVKNLKLPHLLKFEGYNLYVLRMKTMGIIPFHLDFLKKKFGVFLDWKQVTIFEELEVDIKIDVTQKLTNDVQPVDNEVPTIDDLN